MTIARSTPMPVPLRLAVLPGLAALLTGTTA